MRSLMNKKAKLRTMFCYFILCQHQRFSHKASLTNQIRKKIIYVYKWGVLQPNLGNSKLTGNYFFEVSKFQVSKICNTAKPATGQKCSLQWAVCNTVYWNINIFCKHISLLSKSLFILKYSIYCMYIMLQCKYIHCHIIHIIYSVINVTL